MSSIEKLKLKVLQSRNVSFNDAKRVLVSCGYGHRVHALHHIFQKDGASQIVLTRSKRLLPYQVYRVRKAVKHEED